MEKITILRVITAVLELSMRSPHHLSTVTMPVHLVPFVVHATGREPGGLRLPGQELQTHSVNPPVSFPCYPREGWETAR
jgi:hypothetical protein